MELGFALVPPDASACGPIIDHPPAPAGGDALAAYTSWVQAASNQLAQRVSTGAVKIWFPIELPSSPIVPLFGGDPASDWVEALAVLIRLGQDAGGTIQVVDATDAGTSSLLHRTLESGYPGSYAAEDVGPGGSVDPLAGLDAAAATELLAEVFRADDDRRGRNAAATFRSVLGQVLSCLDPTAGLDVGRLAAAIEFAQFAMTTVTGLLRPNEESALLQRVHSRLQHSRPLADGMFELGSLVSVLASFAPSTAPTRRRGDPRRGTVVVSRVTGRAGAGREIAADVVAHRAAETVRKRRPNTVVVLGADRLTPRSLDAIADAAAQVSAQSVVMFARLTEGSGDRLGWRGSTVAGFFRLVNPRDAARAAEFLGRRHQFVLSGRTETEGQSFEWGWSSGTSSSTDRSTSRSWQLGHVFSRTRTSAVSHSTSASQGQSQGQGRSTSQTRSFERVYEHLLEPTVFQQLDAGALLLVDVRTASARLASCQREIARSRLVDWTRTLSIAD